MRAERPLIPELNRSRTPAYGNVNLPRSFDLPILESRIRTGASLHQLKKGVLTYGEFGRRMEFKLDDDVRVGYIGYATKSAS